MNRYFRPAAALLLLVLSLFLLSSLATAQSGEVYLPSISVDEAAPDPNMSDTAATQTAIAQLVKTSVAATLTAWPTATPTPTPTVTPTPSPTLTPTPGLFVSCAEVTQIPQQECDALVALYNSTNGPEWENRGRWLFSDQPCTWFGIECREFEDGEHVVLLHLDGNDLVGTIPNDIRYLIQLEVLSLSFNAYGKGNLHGSIPVEIGQLTNLREILLHGNNLTGMIPPAIGSLANLERLNLLDNNLSGKLPSELGDLSSLIRLNIAQSSELTGSIPERFTNLDNLTEFEFWDTQLCEPPDEEFQTWIRLIPSVASTNVLCDDASP